MGGTTLVFSVLFLGVALLANAQTNAPDTCSLQCTVTKQPNNDNNGSFVVYMRDHIIYVYMIEYNAFVVINLNLRLVVVLDGNNGVLSNVNPDTGFGITINVQTDLVFAIYENRQVFKIDTIRSGDYTVVISIIEYVYQYIDRVVGDNIDTTQTGYTRDVILLRDYATTTNYVEWVSYGNQTEVIQQFINENDPLTQVLHDLFQSGNYTVEWGPAMYVVAVTEMNLVEDPLQREFINFSVSIVRTLLSKFSSGLMSVYYSILVNQHDQTVEETLKQYTTLTWTIIGVGTTYETLEEALSAFSSHTVVQTYISTIRVSNETSYVTYNSMNNGKWLFRITYNQHQYVQVTASYYDGYMGIFDPSADYTIVFTRTNKFGLINYKTGSGFIIDGLADQAVYITSSSDEIIKAFANGQYINGFKSIQALAEGTEITGDNSLVATDFFVAVQNGEPVDKMLKPEQLQSFQADFSSLSEALSTITFDKQFGISSVVIVMLEGPNNKFFQDGFVAMLSKMFEFSLGGGPMYRICYAGILDNIQKKFSEPMFTNIYKLMTMLKKNKDTKKEDLEKFLEDFVRLSTNIDVRSEQFTKTGSITE